MVALKKFSLLFSLTFVVALSCDSVCAFEFSISGEYENRLMYYERIGRNDLFGDALTQDKAQDAVLVGFAGPNSYNAGALPTVAAPTSNFFYNLGSAPGRQTLITRGGFSTAGSSAQYNDSRLTLALRMRLHEAASVGTTINIGGYRNKYTQNSALGNTGQGVPPLERAYVSQAGVNAYDTLSLISVEQLWAKLTLPWGAIKMGPRAFTFGTGATFGMNTRSEMFLIVVPYGPFRLMTGIWPFSARIPSIWSNIPDSDKKNTTHFGVFSTYDQGSLRIGLGTIIRKFHGNNIEPYLYNVDENTMANIAYLKYNNGRFFANVEYAWMNQNRYKSVNFERTPTDTISGTETLFMEGYHFFGEIGLMMGPYKLSFMSALASGPVLNDNNKLRNVHAGGFFLADATAAPYSPGKNPKVYVPWPINYQAMAPYEFLMFNTYAGGNNGGWNALDFTYVADNHGMMSDGYCFASRLDFAVASNLNIWGSYIWAHRAEQAGVYLGQYQSSGSLTAGSIPNVTKFYENAGRAFGVGADYVSNGYIGSEFNIGLDWKLLEGVTYHARYTHWDPGEYFREAYQSVRLNDINQVTTTGVLQSRDAIQAFQSSVILSF